MRKILLALLLVVALCVGVIPSSVSAQQVQPWFMDPVLQLSGDMIEHYVFWKTYAYAMFQNSPSMQKQVRWVVTDNAILNQTLAAVTSWNDIRPTGIEMMTAGGYYDADVVYYYSNCPWANPDNTLGCTYINQWSILGTHNVKAWHRAYIHIRPDYYTRSDNGVIERYGTGALQGTIAHETGHALGLNDQYYWYDEDSCNSAITTIMDGYYKNPYYEIHLCDTNTPNSQDDYMWERYQTAGRYLPFDYLVSPGLASTRWFDYGWNDYRGQATWYWGNVLNGPWTQFAQTLHIGNNGSHQDVPGAGGFRLTATINPTTYGVFSKYIRVCTRPIYNWQAPIGEEQCMAPFWFY